VPNAVPKIRKLVNIKSCSVAFAKSNSGVIIY